MTSSQRTSGEDKDPEKCPIVQAYAEMSGSIVGTAPSVKFTDLISASWPTEHPSCRTRFYVGNISEGALSAVFPP